MMTNTLVPRPRLIIYGFVLDTDFSKLTFILSVRLKQVSN